MILNTLFSIILYDLVVNSILSDDSLFDELVGIMNFDLSFTFSHARIHWASEFWRALC